MHCRLPNDEIAVFQDGADLHLNPEGRKMRMRHGAHAALPQPEDNEKSFLVGSLPWRTGKLR
jgi:hypothetical protein